MIPGVCDKQYSRSANIQLFVTVTCTAFCFVQRVHNVPGPFHTVRSQTDIHRRLKSLEEVVGKELGAPYTCQIIPETRQIVRTPEKESTSPG